MGRKKEKLLVQENEGVIDALVERYYKDILYFVASKVGWNRAEEVAQGAMLRIVEHIKSLKDPESAKPWMLTVALNECNSFHRKTFRTMKHVDESELDVESAPIEDEFLPSDLVEQQEARKAVFEALQELPESYADCLVLYYFNEESYASIAKILGISESKVGSDLFRGRQMLKAKLEKKLGTSMTYGVTAGAVPVLTQLFEQDAQASVSIESFGRCKEYLRTELFNAVDPQAMTQEKGFLSAKAIAVAAVGAVVLAGAVAAFVVFDGAQEEAVVVQPEQTAPALEEALTEPEPAPTPVETPINTVADMISNERALELDSYVAEGVEADAWAGFVEAIGAVDEDTAVEGELIYRLYVLHKQDKQLLLIQRQSANSTSVDIRYVFQEEQEIKPMILMTFLFD